VRRKFIEAQKTQAKDKMRKADWAVNHIQKLYRIEKEIKSQTATKSSCFGNNSQNHYWISLKRG
jgi:hypothetical protein